MHRLICAINDMRNPSIVGLDPTQQLIPRQVVRTAMDRAGHGSVPESAACATDLSEAFLAFNHAVIDAVADIVPAVKPQIAMYEALGPEGLFAYAATCAYARSRGLYVLGDIKRGDIGSTASAYARHLGGGETDGGKDDASASACDFWHEDAVTVNPYLGFDGVRPFVEAARRHDKDVFILVRTSNPSSSQIQELALARGEALYEHVGDLVEQWGVDDVDDSGYSRVAAVVGATHPDQGAALRRRMPHTFFLVPGYGAQGGTARDAAAMFDDHGSGAIVNSSRGIIGAWRRSPDYRSGLSSPEALSLVSREARAAAIAMRDDLRNALYQ
ncbi:MAG: orotidine-5'-phosphate decarboxylase [Bifidobacterium sp.]|jgi:orotidine-5'-phosphate decarboxylase|nr:orotidine-5'-phosphate decarboxylase [Bifidobacterium sp.]